MLGDGTYDIAIVGGGLSGCALALALAKIAPRGCSIRLIEDGTPGAGAAYGTTPGVFMNGPVRAMSAVADDPSHLARFANEAGADDLIERRRFGAYVRSLLAEAQALHPELSISIGRIADISDRGPHYELTDAAARRFRAKYVVLALGNCLPNPGVVPAGLRGDDRVIGNPWNLDARALRGDVAIVGSGLTAMDAIAQLSAQQSVERIHVISPRDFPHVEHPWVRALDPLTLNLDTSTPLRLLRTMRRAARLHAKNGGDWRAVVEAIRSSTPAIWASWDVTERRRFRRHLESRWCAYRYRVPGQTAYAAARAMAEGRLYRHEARLSGGRAADRLYLSLKSAWGAREVEADALINCTGPSSTYGLASDPLLRSLRERGTIRADALNLGLDVTPGLRLRDASGMAHQRLFTLGPPARGTFYESTAVPEIRSQSAALAQSLLHLISTSTIGAA